MFISVSKGGNLIKIDQKNAKFTVENKLHIFGSRVYTVYNDSSGNFLLSYWEQFFLLIRR